MHVMAPLPINTFLPIFFNVDTSVGNNGMNSNRIDILLVQFLIRKSAALAAADLRPDRRARMARVVTDGFSGPNTIDGIRAVQEAMRDRQPGTVIDGRVSRARGVDYSSTGSWTIVSLNNSIRTRSLNIWPRLQDFPDCPGELKAEFPKVL